MVVYRLAASTKARASIAEWPRHHDVKAVIVVHKTAKDRPLESRGGISVFRRSFGAHHPASAIGTAVGWVRGGRARATRAGTCLRTRGATHQREQSQRNRSGGKRDRGLDSNLSIRAAASTARRLEKALHFD